jgi:hypothetical protein
LQHRQHKRSTHHSGLQIKELLNLLSTALQTGYVALLDVLGFSSLVSSERHNERISDYLGALQEILENTPLIEYLVFSDSILITTTNDTQDALQAMIERCSRLFGQLLERNIPVRGAVAHGTYVSEKTRNGKFVAGRAIIKAYQFEEQQDWIGIMLAPSVVDKADYLARYCALPASARSPIGGKGRLFVRERFVSEYREFKDHIPWAAHVQPYYGIPFHEGTYDGYAIVPTTEKPLPTNLGDLAGRLDQSLLTLRRLRSVAPSPEIQLKYKRTIDWLGEVRSEWLGIASKCSAFAQDL